MPQKCYTEVNDVSNHDNDNDSDDNDDEEDKKYVIDNEDDNDFITYYKRYQQKISQQHQ